MSVTVNEVLKLEKIRGFKAVAGIRGLSNRVKKVGILDYEKDELIAQNFIEGEFVISTLFVIKDSIEELYNLVEKMIEVGASGLAIKNIYFNKLPNNVIELANKKSFPIFLFSDVYFEDIITSIISKIKESETYEFLESKVEEILNKDYDGNMIRKTAFEINSRFKENHVVAYFKSKDQARFSISIDNDEFQDIIIPFREGYLIISTFEEDNVNKINKIVKIRLRIEEFNYKGYIIGISSVYKGLDKLKLSIQESIYAYQHSVVHNKGYAFFGEIGTDRFILPMISNQWILKYHDSIINPLIEYDKKSGTDLLKTAIIYVENNGDIKAAARDLFQHDNTVRYRINKIYKLFSRGKFKAQNYEELAMAVHIHQYLDIK